MKKPPEGITSGRLLRISWTQRAYRAAGGNSTLAELGGSRAGQRPVIGNRSARTLPTA